MRHGAFITIEGSEGVGKSSSVAVIDAWLHRHGVPARLTREPGGTPLGEAVRSWVLDGDHGRLGPKVETLLMFAARAQHLSEVIRPAVAAGMWVVCDRFTDATIAYQGGGRGDEIGFLRSLAEAVHGDMTPDLTLLLDAPVQVGLDRIADRPHDHFEREQHDFFARVRETYLDLAAAEPARFRVIDASVAPVDVAAQIESALVEFRLAFDSSQASSA